MHCWKFSFHHWTTFFPTKRNVAIFRLPTLSACWQIAFLNLDTLWFGNAAREKRCPLISSLPALPFPMICLLLCSRIFKCKIRSCHFPQTFSLSLSLLLFGVFCKILVTGPLHFARPPVQHLAACSANPFFLQRARPRCKTVLHLFRAGRREREGFTLWNFSQAADRRFFFSFEFARALCLPSLQFCNTGKPLWYGRARHRLPLLRRFANSQLMQDHVVFNCFHWNRVFSFFFGNWSRY